MKNTKTLDFSGKKIYGGIDVHKKTWMVYLRTENVNLGKISFQRPFVKNLSNYLIRNFPNAEFICAYEAGFCGFAAQMELESLGIKCIVVNPADIPVSNKDKQFKTDLRDSKKIANCLKSGELTGIYIPSIEAQRDRSLIRERANIVKDMTRLKNQIKSHLFFFSIDISEEYDNRYWSMKFIEWLKEISEKKCDITLEIKINKIEILRKHMLHVTRQIRSLSRNEKHKKLTDILLSVPGVGIVHCMVLITELIDIHRFKNEDHLFSYSGLIPTSFSSGEKQRIGNITNRGNHRIRTALVESAWSAIRKDYELLCRYEEYKKRMPANKAIIKIAKTLLRRIKWVWINQQKYKMDQG